MNNMPLVSIVIPVYNGSNYLREAVDSALNQTYKNCEILVVNDGSDDGGATEKAALSYGNKIRYIVKQNGGTASALNAGIRNMKGEYFSWLSHDDVYYPDKIEKEMEAVRCSGDAAKLVQCEYTFYDVEKKVYTPTGFHEFYDSRQLTNSVFSVLQLQIHACAALVHKSHFDRVGCFLESIRTVQDIEMWFRMFRGQKSIFVPEVLYMVREHKEAGNRTLDVYYQETCRLYDSLLRKMDLAEMERVFGSAYRFLIRMIGFLKSYQADTSEWEQLLDKCEPNQWDEQNRMEVVRRFWAGQVYIFGAGQYGVRMLYELEARGIDVRGFLDNNKEKWGQRVNGKLCSPPCILEDTGQRFIVILAVRNDAGIVKQLAGCPNVQIERKRELDGIFSRSG